MTLFAPRCSVHGFVQRMRVPFGLGERTIRGLVVEQPHHGRADDERVDVDVVLPVLRKKEESRVKWGHSVSLQLCI